MSYWVKIDVGCCCQDPERFLPERLLEGSPEYEEGIYKKWLPFGDGARACIGARFALMVP